MKKRQQTAGVSQMFGFLPLSVLNYTKLNIAWYLGYGTAILNPLDA